ncbi:MAG: 4Fe-4S dicluster domain-containing protein, partial [Candidatus Bathyarchaeota archaeon]
SCVVTCSLVKHRVFSKKKALISIWKDENRCLGIPLICEHCERPPCMEACPQDVITKDSLTGIVTIDQASCTGCGACGEACPFESEIIRLKDGVAIKCDLCGGEPACVKVCLQKALQYVTATKQNAQVKSEWAEKRIRAIRTFKGF